jgi:polyferredoxin
MPLPAATYRALADAVLVLHVGVVIFVVGGLLLILLGNWRGWGWVNAWWFRLAHLAAIAVVAAEAWLGVVCPLTTLEMELRARAGGATYGGSFIGHWLQRFLYYDAPAWVFTLAYSLFAAAVAASWWWFPPTRRGQSHTRRSPRDVA